MILSPGGPIFANKITELQSLSTFNYAVLYSKGVKNAGAVPGFFARGGPTFALQSLSTFKQMLAVCVCFNKHYQF